MSDRHETTPRRRYRSMRDADLAPARAFLRALERSVMRDIKRRITRAR